MKYLLFFSFLFLHVNAESAATNDYYKINKNLEIKRNSGGKLTSCGNMGSGSLIRKVGVCKKGWCQVATPGGKCSGWGWLFVGTRGENAVRYRVPAGRSVTSTRTSSRVQASTTSPAQPTYSQGSTQSPSVSSEISGGPANRTAPSLNVPLLNSPTAAGEFVHDCKLQGIREDFCRQVTSPNTNSRATFNRTYPGKPFFLMPPRSEWRKAFPLLKAIQQSDACVSEIRNWYRPEPYNSNVGGARRSAHISGSAIDIHYCSKNDKCKAMRHFRRLKASTGVPAGIGNYGASSLTIHIDYMNRNYGSSGCR